MANAFQLHRFEPTAFEISVTDVFDQNQLIESANLDVVGGTSTSAAQAQSFVPTGTVVSAVQLRVFKAGTPTDNTIVEIQTDASNLPSGTVVGTSVSIPSANLLTAFRWHEFAVNAPVTVGIKYWMVVRRDIGGAGDATNMPRVRRQGSGNPYASGGRSQLNGSTGVWGAESATEDLPFKTYSLIQKSPPFSNIPRRRSLIRTSL